MFRVHQIYYFHTMLISMVASIFKVCLRKHFLTVLLYYNRVILMGKRGPKKGQGKGGRPRLVSNDPKLNMLREYWRENHRKYDKKTEE